MEQFWESLSNAIRLKNRRLKNRRLNISSRDGFFAAFAAGNFEQPVVLLIDELDKLYTAPGDTRDDFLRTLREIRNNNAAYAIDSIIAAGTLNILQMSTKHPKKYLYPASQIPSKTRILPSRIREHSLTCLRRIMILS